MLKMRDGVPNINTLLAAMKNKETMPQVTVTIQDVSGRSHWHQYLL